MYRRRSSPSTQLLPSIVSTTSATVTASDLGTFSCPNIARRSAPKINPTQFLLGTDVTDKDGNPFTVFS